MLRHPGRKAGTAAGLVFATMMVGQSAASSSSTSEPRPDITVKSFLLDIGAHKISAAKSFMTLSYENFMRRAADSLFTNVITLTHITVGKVHYSGVRHANVPCTFVHVVVDNAECANTVTAEQAAVAWGEEINLIQANI